MTIGLTQRQLDLLRFITGYYLTNGVSPSMDECRCAMGLASKSGIVRLLGGLEERGSIVRRHFSELAIEVLAPISIPRAPDGSPLYAVPLPTLRDRA